MREDRIIAVVVTYNRKETLVKCVDAILHQSRKPDEVLIIDNNSTDGTKAYLDEAGTLNDASVIYHKLDENIGGAGGFHEGMKLAMSHNASWTWIMDDDVIPEPDCLMELLNARSVIKEDVSFLASSIRGMDNGAMNVPKINRNQFTKYTDWYEYLDEGIVKIVKATFVSLLINGEAIKKCGYPWTPFFIWGDDSEYTQRIIRDYGPAYMVGKSKATHLRTSGNELSIVTETNPNRIPMYVYYYRNNLIGFWEYEGALYRFLCMGKLAFDFFRVIFKAKYKFKKMHVINKAFWSFVFGTYGRKSFKNRASL